MTDLRLSSIAVREAALPASLVGHRLHAQGTTSEKFASVRVPFTANVLTSTSVPSSQAPVLAADAMPVPALTTGAVASCGKPGAISTVGTPCTLTQKCPCGSPGARRTSTALCDSSGMRTGWPNEIATSAYARALPGSPFSPFGPGSPTSPFGPRGPAGSWPRCSSAPVVARVGRRLRADCGRPAAGLAGAGVQGPVWLPRPNTSSVVASPVVGSGRGSPGTSRIGSRGRR